MASVQPLGLEFQTPAIIMPRQSAELALDGGGWLGNVAIQRAPYNFQIVHERPAFKPLEGSRVRELRWRRENEEALRAFAGEWVAVEGNRILAHGLHLSEVVNAVRAQGVRIPYVFRVEDIADNVVTIGL